MAVQTKLTPINRSIELIMQRSLSPEAQSARLASHAKVRLAEAQEINRQALGRVPPHETFVDTRRGASVDSVKPDGVIVFDFELLDDLFAWIGEQLVLHAPVLTGEYRQSFAFFADGVEVDPGGVVPPASEYVFLNTQPYARKIEKPRAQSDQAPDGVFQAVATLAKKRFGNLAAIRFSYRTPFVATSGTARERREADRENRTPAIVIALR